VDAYRHFDHLRKHAQQGVDYVIRHRHGNSGILLMAPHGGKIEPGTGEIANAVAGRHHSFYSFKGIKKHGNRILHIASNRFDEPRAMTMVQQASWILTLHGCRDIEPALWVGGRDQPQGDRIIKHLQDVGLPAQRCDRPGLRGLHPDNLCNRGRQAAGVQLEISLGLRHLLFTDLCQQRIRSRTPLFYQLVDTLAGCLPLSPA